MITISGLTFFYALLATALGSAGLGAGSHWLVTLIAKIKAWEQAELKKVEAKEPKIKAAIDHDAALVQAALQGMGELWDKLKADAAVFESAKAAAATQPAGPGLPGIQALPLAGSPQPPLTPPPPAAVGGPPVVTG